MRHGKNARVLGLAGLMCLGGVSAEGALLKASGSKTTTTAVSTTTSGQTQIKVTIDPINITSFQVDLQYESDKVTLQSVTGINGYIVTSFTNLPDFQLNPHIGVVQDIAGYYPFFIPSNGPSLGSPHSEDWEGDEDDEPEFGAPTPPAQPTNLVELIFLDLDPSKPKSFLSFFSPNDFLSGIDADTGSPFTATGADLVNDGSIAVVAGVGGAGGSSVPLPAALPMGLLTSGGAVWGALKKRRSARR